MQRTRFLKVLSLLLCFVLIAAMALLTIGCKDSNVSSGDDLSSEIGNAIVLGEGEKEFTFTVTDGDGKLESFQIHTDKKTVGDALLELKLISGDAGDYGLYVKTVNGITVDYNEDGKYWAFYVNGDYATAAVDKTEIEAGSTYSFKVE